MRKRYSDDETGGTQWDAVICRLKAQLEPLGCTVDRSPHDYEIAKVAGDGVRLVVYQYRSNTRHPSARIRDNGSKDKAAADRAMAASGLWTKNRGALYMDGPGDM